MPKMPAPTRMPRSRRSRRASRRLLEPSPQPFQLATAYRPFLGNPVGAWGEEIELAVLWQQLDLYARPGVVPGLVDKPLLQPGQTHRADDGRFRGDRGEHQG